MGIFDFLRRKKKIEVLPTEFGKQIPVDEIEGFVLKGKMGKKKEVIIGQYDTAMMYGECDIPDEDKYSLIKMYIKLKSKHNVAYWAVDKTEGAEEEEVPEDVEKMFAVQKKAALHAKAMREQAESIAKLYQNPEIPMDEMIDKMYGRIKHYADMGTKMGMGNTDPYKNQFLQALTDPRIRNAGMGWLGQLT